MKRNTLIVGNWKLHGDIKSVVELSQAVSQGWSGSQQVSVAVCPSFAHLSVVSQALSGAVGLGAQDVSMYSQGAYTGDVSASMLADLGCQFSLVGHSERRSIFGDSDEDVAAKFIAVKNTGITPILCVGESLEERQNEMTQSVVCRQVSAVIDRHGIEALENSVIAYEPCWAIGSGLTATPTQAQEVHAILRAYVAEFSPSIADTLCILYGGSVKSSNAGEILQQPDVDGVLVGGASLKAQEFLAICQQGVESLS